MKFSKNKSTLSWLALVGGSFLRGLAASWLRWGNPLIDCGREMNQPLRLLRGEMLYSDVRHIYGPLSPYLNAALYGLFGPSLTVLYANGAVTALVVIALIYWLARQLMDEAASALATLSVLWMCVFKAAGNYLLPYSYSALHATALSIIALALIIRFVRLELTVEPEAQRSASGYLLAAGLVGGLSVLAKLEMGVAAVGAGLIAVFFTNFPHPRRIILRGALFTLPAVLLIVAVYGFFAARVGWHTLTHDGFLLLGNIPPELVYFNQAVSGFDAPGRSLLLMLQAVLRMTALASGVALISRFFARRSSPPGVAGRKNIGDRFWALTLLISAGAAVALPLLYQGLPLDQGPYLMMPVLLLALLLVALGRARKEIAETGHVEVHICMLLVMTVFALISISRMILHARSGGSYGSYLLPSSSILFTYAWTEMFPRLLGPPVAREAGRRIMCALLFLSIFAMAGVTIYRYRTKNTYELRTSRGTMISEPELGVAFGEAVDFINRETLPGDSIVVVPEGTSLAFLTDRRQPLREEIITPGFLDTAGEERAIRQIADADTKIIMLTNRPTKEFGATVFGRDYNVKLMSWIEEHYEPVATFGARHDPGLQIGEKPFFIHAYRRREAR